MTLKYNSQMLKLLSLCQVTTSLWQRVPRKWGYVYCVKESAFALLELHAPALSYQFSTLWSNRDWHHCKDILFQSFSRNNTCCYSQVDKLSTVGMSLTSSTQSTSLCWGGKHIVIWGHSKKKFKRAVWRLLRVLLQLPGSHLCPCFSLAHLKT